VTADRADSPADDFRADRSPRDVGAAGDDGGRLESIGRFARNTGLSVGALRHDLTTEREKIMPSSTFALDPDDERRLAAALFNRTWELLMKPERSIADDDEMIHAAHASRYHWGVVGTPVNFARGEWQCTRVYSVLGRAEPALHHARRCLSLATENDLGAFDIGAANEAMARAYRVAGDPDRVAIYVAAADDAATQVTDAEDRKILEDDLADLRP
jgi:hypothetical protein